MVIPESNGKKTILFRNEVPFSLQPKPRMRPKLLAVCNVLAIIIAAMQLHIIFSLDRAGIGGPLAAAAAGSLAAKLEKAAHHADHPRIWTYWHDDDPPTLVRDIIFGWKRFNPDYTIVSDWVRLAVLMQHGGFWLDASVVVTRSLDELVERQRTEATAAWRTGVVGSPAVDAARFNATRTEAFQYYISRYTRHPSVPVLESWFLATVPGGRYVTALFMEFNFAMANFRVNEGYSQYLRERYSNATYEDAIRQRSDLETYLVIHLCAGKVVAVDGVPPPMTECAEDGPNRFQKENGWKDALSADAFRRNYTSPWTREAFGAARAVVGIRPERRKSREWERPLTYEEKWGTTTSSVDDSDFKGIADIWRERGWQDEKFHW
ncbi:hypothetical protein HDU96_005035 [Phlyctochytrium bullatum]|nr:hypothetical protein HDU96_005035 [Phlyctochytrium bullatum]